MAPVSRWGWRAVYTTLRLDRLGTSWRCVVVGAPRDLSHRSGHRMSGLSGCMNGPRPALPRLDRPGARDSYWVTATGTPLRLGRVTLAATYCEVVAITRRFTSACAPAPGSPWPRWSHASLGCSHYEPPFLAARVLLDSSQLPTDSRPQILVVVSTPWPEQRRTQPPRRFAWHAPTVDQSSQTTRIACSSLSLQELAYCAHRAYFRMTQHGLDQSQLPSEPILYHTATPHTAMAPLAQILEFPCRFAVLLKTSFYFVLHATQKRTRRRVRILQICCVE